MTLKIKFGPIQLQLIVFQVSLQLDLSPPAASSAS